MLRYDIATGDMFLDGALIGVGYSGAGSDKNSEGAVLHQGTGPIPPGLWSLDGVKDSATTGPFTIVLSPLDVPELNGRSAFRIHGDSIAHPGQASHGCIILQRKIRERIWNSGQRKLTVS